KAIEVRGNKKIDKFAILAKIKSKEEQALNQEQLREDLKAIYQMGFFEDVMVSTEELEGGVRVVFAVMETPFLIEIQFSGNEKIETETLKDKITLKTQTFVDRQQVKENAEKLREHYEKEGYFEVRVIPFLKAVEEDKVTLTFFIKEGSQAKIRRILFEGRHALPARELRKEIETRQYFWLTSWLTSSGIYKKEILEQDVERIKELYLDQGYLQVQVGTPRVVLSQGKQWFDIIFPIVEGEQFRVRAIEFSGNTLFTAEQLRPFLKLKGGEVLKRNLLHESVRFITDEYGEKGYIFTQVIPRLNPDPLTQAVDVVLEVREQGPVTVRRINILGNEKTRDKVIRRELRVNEQEVINTQSLKRSFQRLNNLNFFESVEIVPQEVKPDVVDLNVRIKEKPTGTFSVGGGYSSVDRLVALVEITQGNLFGRGQLLRGRLETGRRRTTYSLTFREPYLLDYPVAGTTDLFDQERNFNSYKEGRRGGSIVLSKAFNEYVDASVGYTLESLRVFETPRVDEMVGMMDLNGDGVIESSACTAATLICNQEKLGRTTTSSVSMSVARDTRDFFFDPRQGSRNAISYEHAGTFMGGGNDYYKVILDSSRYFPLWLDTVVSVHGRLGYAQGMRGKELPQGERFYVGGLNSIRGFDFGRAGPVENGDVVGGNKQLIFNAEYLFPILAEAKIKGVLFFDAGRGFNNAERIDLVSPRLRYGAGFGIRLLLPIGPIRLEWGKNLDPELGEKSGFLPEFSIGTLF
ncbi:MAG TPA: outer membrane protein assembly factor BamA, partial [Nitrospiria bacterium]|nr:outer membrane protein assembly factor BamA [Nitrospiria bacterium]